MLCESDAVPVLVLLHIKAGRGQNLPQPKASEDHNYSQHQQGTFEVAKRLMEAIVFAQCPSLTIIDENYLMVDRA
jgi:hypothetical protein